MEIHRICEVTATPHEEGASLSEQSNNKRIVTKIKTTVHFLWAVFYDIGNFVPYIIKTLREDAHDAQRKTAKTAAHRHAKHIYTLVYKKLHNTIQNTGKGEDEHGETFIYI